MRRELQAGHLLGWRDESGFMADVLVLHGSPGSGKSTLARALAPALGAADVAWGVIDMDELSLVHPYPDSSFPRENLRAIWPNYIAAVPGINLIIPLDRRAHIVSCCCAHSDVSRPPAHAGRSVQ